MGDEKINLFDEARVLKVKDIINLMTSDDYLDNIMGDYLYSEIKRNNIEENIVKLKAKQFKNENQDNSDNSLLSVLEDQLYYLNEYIMALKVRAEVEGIKI